MSWSRTSETACSSGCDATSASTNARGANDLDNYGTRYATYTSARRYAGNVPMSTDVAHGDDGCSNCVGTSASSCGPCATVRRQIVEECVIDTNGGLCDGTYPRSIGDVDSSGCACRGASTSGRDANDLGSYGTECASGTSALQYDDSDPISTWCVRATDGCSSYGCSDASMHAHDASELHPTSSGHAIGNGRGHVECSGWPRTSEACGNNGYVATNASKSARDANGPDNCGKVCASDTSGRRCA